MILELHDKIDIPALLVHAESWNLNKSERSLLEKIEVQTIKFLFDLPSHTPTPAILFMFGRLYTGHLLDQRRLIYLHRILKRHDQHWTKQAFNELSALDIGWANSIKKDLRVYDLPENFDDIKATTRRIWIKTVKQKIEVSNTKQLVADCHKLIDGVKTPKSKTAFILNELSDDAYRRKVHDDVLLCTKHEAKTLMIARFGMLECGKNFRGSIRETCEVCKVTDDENHRLNDCSKFSSVNNFMTEKTDFRDIFSNDPIIFKDAIKNIEKVWNTRTAHGTMKTC